MSFLVNLTPHRIVETIGKVDLPPADYNDVIRIYHTQEKIGSIMDAPVYSISLELAIDLPEKKDGCFYVVSKRVAEAILLNHPERDDFLYPGEMVYENKKPVGCKGFVSTQKKLKGKIC